MGIFIICGDLKNSRTGQFHDIPVIVPGTEGIFRMHFDHYITRIENEDNIQMHFMVVNQYGRNLNGFCKCSITFSYYDVDSDHFPLKFALSCSKIEVEKHCTEW